MKTRLNELSLAQFIELVCGDYSVLLADGETTDKMLLEENASELLVSYRCITDNANFKAQLMEKEECVKSKAKILILRLCSNLIAYKSYNDVLTLLESLDEDVLGLSDNDINEKVDEMLRTALFEAHRSELVKEKEVKVVRSPDEIRASFDTEIAFVMTHFKMSIDINTINAAVYANMLHQAEIQLKPKPNFGY
ncbi:hypothetical protein [Bacteroides sp.]|uniref:hypothetical protein n=1 Tax=Bacteroides sp. TaxID=29523 RepID=UPI00260F6443|nr:hypothetical protein [Bacteroides sp.]